MIELYGMSSPNVAKVMLMLEEVELPYAFIGVDVFRGEQHEPGFRALNPNGKAPVLVDPDGCGDGPITLWESGAILFYLAEKVGRLLPPAGTGRHAVMQWLMFQMSGVGPTFGQAMHFSFLTEEDGYARTRFQTEMHRIVDVVEARLAASPFLAGDSYTIADVATFSWIERLSRAFPPSLDRPALRGWLGEIAARPAAERMTVRLKALSKLDIASRQAATPDMMDRYLGRGAYARPV